MQVNNITPDTSFHGLARTLLDEMRSKKGSDIYYLFTREEAKKLNFIIKNIWSGRALVSVSYFYKGDETIAFCVKKSDIFTAKSYPLALVGGSEARTESLEALFSEDVELTEEDKDFIRRYFKLEKAA